LAGQFSDHESSVWRVCWNVTGTILATSGDDGLVRLWKANYLDNWKCVAVLRGDGVSGPGIASINPDMGKMTGQEGLFKTSPGIAFTGGNAAQIWN
jgi:WD40 repeat protein